MADSDTALELAVFNGLQEVLAQLKEAGVRSASFGRLTFEFFPESAPSPVPTTPVDGRVVSPGYARLFPDGPPSFALLK